MIGKTAFAENRWYNFEEAELLVEKLLNNLPDDDLSYRAKWTTEELAQSRLLRMAGLEDC
jgi:hypothetical protein